VNPQAERLLDQAARAIESRPSRVPASADLRVGVDLGTATMVLLVLDSMGQPVAGRLTPAAVVRDGLVVDFIGAVDQLRQMKAEVESELGVELTEAASAFPPGVGHADAQAAGHVLGSAGLSCTRLIDEPSAANQVLGLTNGALVDVGGGTTGLAILQDGQVVYTADEATGGTHFNLVIAGALGLTYEAAQVLKETPEEQPRLMALVRPVIEKVGAIITRHIQGWDVDRVTLVGGASAFQGLPAVLEEYLGLPVRLAPHPQLVTPLGIALAAGLEPARSIAGSAIDWSRA
jgi:ethanolamine utilization protein EutJ